MRSIAWISEKGGTGKTTSAINTAAALAKRGKRVLLVDVDPQSNASLVLLEGRSAGAPTLHHVLVEQAEALEAIRSTRYAKLDLLPAEAALAEANVALAGELGRERRLRVAMEQLEGRYDFILFDTSPQRSLLNVNVLNCAAELLVPIDPGIFSLAGLGQLQLAVDEVRRYLDNRALRIAGLVLTQTQRNNVSRDVESQLRERYGDLVMRTTIPHSIKLEEAHGRFLSVLDYAPSSPGAKAYKALVAEILDHGRTKDRTGTVAGESAAPDVNAA